MVTAKPLKCAEKIQKRGVNEVDPNNFNEKGFITRIPGCKRIWAMYVPLTLSNQHLTKLAGRGALQTSWFGGRRRVKGKEKRAIAKERRGVAQRIVVGGKKRAAGSCLTRLTERTISAEENTKKKKKKKSSSKKKEKRGGTRKKRKIIPPS